MRNLLALLALGAILFAAVGFGRGWYSLTLVSAGAGRVAFLVEVDAYRIAGDLAAVGRGTVHLLAGGKREPAAAP